jgi:hypothetical protein
MTITLEIPDQLAASLESRCPELAQGILERFAVEAYRDGTLSAVQIRTLLGHDSRLETEAFLAAHGAWPTLTVDEIIADAQVAAEAARNS